MHDPYKRCAHMPARGPIHCDMPYNARHERKPIGRSFFRKLCPQLHKHAQSIWLLMYSSTQRIHKLDKTWWFLLFLITRS